MSGAIHSGGASALPLTLIAQAIPRLSRLDLEALTERLIETLDELDGDPDLEDYDVDEEDDDPAGGNCEDEGEPQETFVPTFGMDQTKGPLPPI